MTHFRLQFIILSFGQLFFPSLVWFLETSGWGIVALQYYISSCCTEKGISYMFTYSPYFLDFLPIDVTMETTERWAELPVSYGRFSPAVYFIYSINMYICQPPDSSHLHVPLTGVHVSTLLLCLCLLCKQLHLYQFSRFYIYTLIYDIFAFLFLTYFTL